MENNTSTNNENGNDANCFFEPVFDSFPLWTMLSEIPRNRWKYHIATDTFTNFCGKTNMIVRDRIVFESGSFYYTAMGLGQTVKKKLDDFRICKRCLSSRHIR